MQEGDCADPSAARRASRSTRRAAIARGARRTLGRSASCEGSIDALGRELLQAVHRCGAALAYDLFLFADSRPCEGCSCSFSTDAR
jgi:hypothetical protein